MTDMIKGKLVQKRLLIPLTLILASLAVAFSFAFIQSQNSHHDQIRQNLLDTSMKTLHNSLIDQSNFLSALAYTIAQDKKLQLALKKQNREQLLSQFSYLFNQLKHDYSITHLYFHRPDRINLLRVHKPEKYGDLITRHTALEAERTQRISSGIELGPLGTFTLRVVIPVHADDQLIGYLELGKEIEDVLARIHENQKIELTVTIKKKLLNQTQWEQGMKMLGRQPTWDRFSSEVIIYHSQSPFPLEFEPLLKNYWQEQYFTNKFNYQGKIWHGIVTPLSDATGATVGHLILWYDHTEQHKIFSNLIKKVIIGTATLLGILFIYLWVILRRTDKMILNQHTDLLNSHADLEKAHLAMEKLATTDVLTGLPNRRFALQALERLWAEANDNTAALGCLLIDADGFKSVNDTYGHDAGDKVLRELAKHLKNSVRTDDIVCRLGGDEFLVICPNTNKEGLENIANQIQNHIRDLSIQVLGGTWHGSISIGAAIKTPVMHNMEELIKAADNGVYAAKKNGRNCVKFATS